MRHKNENMVNVDSTKVLGIDKLENLNRLASAIGCGRGYLRNALSRGRISGTVLESICRYYGTTPADYVVPDKPKTKTGLEEAVMELLIEHEEETGKQLEAIRVKHDRDLAELRGIITSLQVQLEQVKNERRTA